MSARVPRLIEKLRQRYGKLPDTEKIRKRLEPMATEYTDELRVLRDQVLAVVQQLDTGGLVDQFQSSVGDLRRRAPNQALASVVRALVAALATIDTYLQT
jgi:hypothetical protein